MRSGVKGQEELFSQAAEATSCSLLTPDSIWQHALEYTQLFVL